MRTLTIQLTPSITDMIRMDHNHVLATFQQVHAGTSGGRKQALVRLACTSLEIHAQLEEEIFYPALRELRPDLTVIEKSVPEHAEMRRLIERLMVMPVADPSYDATFMELMRDVLHHVADEETTLLPAAERLLGERLSELGARMLRRRLQLLAPRSPQLVWNTLRSMPQSGFVMASSLLAAGGSMMGRTAPSSPRPFP
ncbi:MAG: hemerythrin domain-containing protein [Methylibium sp.]|nr:hemerythrin domain-containing protein [Methylibium sp.]